MGKLRSPPVALRRVTQRFQGGFGPFQGLVTWPLAPAAVSGTKAQDKADRAFTVQGPSKAVYTEGDGQIFSCKLSSIPNGKFHLNLL